MNEHIVPMFKISLDGIKKNHHIEVKINKSFTV